MRKFAFLRESVTTWKGVPRRKYLLKSVLFLNVLYKIAFFRFYKKIFLFLKIYPLKIYCIKPMNNKTAYRLK